MGKHLTREDRKILRTAGLLYLGLIAAILIVSAVAS